MYIAVIQASDLQPYSSRVFVVLTLYIDRIRSVLFDPGTFFEVFSRLD